VDIALPTSDEDLNFHIEAGLYYPEVTTLLESIVKLRVKGDASSQWGILLDGWTISYLNENLHL
jgi:hypothetical protein